MTAIHRKIYVLQPRALEDLAGDNQDLRRADGSPNYAAIGVAAGLDYTTIHQLMSGKINLSARVMAALTDLYMQQRRVSDIKAHAKLFALVDPSARRLKAVAA